MKNEPKCPYCGEPMRLDADSCHIWMKCESCLSCSPKVYRPDWNNSEFPFAGWSDFWCKCKEIVQEVALRRPLQKPLTKEEIFELIASNEEFVTWNEYKKEGLLFPQIWSDGEVISDVMCPIATDKIVWDTYGKTWRNWASRPTDEERAAAPWEE